MDSIIVNLKGTLYNTKIIKGGVTFLNPTRTPYKSNVINIYTREPNKSNSSISITLKTYDGKIGSTSGEFTVEKTENINGVIVRTYTTKLTSGSTSYTDLNSNTYIGRQIRLIDSNNIPYRIDVIGNNLDISLTGDSTTGYDNPLIIDAEQIKYSSIPTYSKYIKIMHSTGEINTKWFRNNTNIVSFQIYGKYTMICGNIMDFVKCGHTLKKFIVTDQLGIYGVMSEFLNALKKFGVKNKKINMHISGTNIIQDVYPGANNDYSNHVFDVNFSSTGAWTISV